MADKDKYRKLSLKDAEEPDFKNLLISILTQKNNQQQNSRKQKQTIQFEFFNPKKNNKSKSPPTQKIMSTTTARKPKLSPSKEYGVHNLQTTKQLNRKQSDGNCLKKENQHYFQDYKQTNRSQSQKKFRQVSTKTSPKNYEKNYFYQNATHQETVLSPKGGQKSNNTILPSPKFSKKTHTTGSSKKKTTNFSLKALQNINKIEQNLSPNRITIEDQSLLQQKSRIIANNTVSHISFREDLKFKEILGKVVNRTNNILNRYKEGQEQWNRKKKAMQNEIDFFKKILSTNEQIVDILEDG